MKNHIENKWDWPEELDALIAAPRHHKLLFENSNIRILETNILPGETTEIHTHRWPAFMYVISISDFIRYDDKKNIIFDSRTLSIPVAASTSIWSEPLTPHALENIGNKEIKIISVEIKNDI